MAPIATSSITNNKKLSVRFDVTENRFYEDRVLVRERKSLYYSSSELKCIRRELGSAIRKRVRESNDFCRRGLEHVMNGTCEETQERRYAFLKQFISLQFELRRWKQEQGDVLRTFTDAHSKNDCQIARLRAKRDEAEAKVIHKEVNLIIWDLPKKAVETSAIMKTVRRRDGSFKDIARIIFPTRESMAAATA
jgi:hypothetical protein